MAEMSAATSAITLGGKGSHLSSSSLFAIATGLTQLRIDLSVLDALSSSKKQVPSIKHKIVVPEHFSLDKGREFLVVLLNALLISDLSGIRSLVPQMIVEKINSNPQTLDFEEIDVTEDEFFVLSEPSPVLVGITGILDHQATALSTFVDAAAAFSCVASGADVTAFDIIDSGDGYTRKEEVGVASDMKVLLNGCKLGGKVEVESISKIPKIHGSFREQVKFVHSTARIELNSGLKIGKKRSGSSGREKLVRTVLLPLAAALLDLGECSLGRAKSNLEALGSSDLRANLDSVFEKTCPSIRNLNNNFKRVLDLVVEKAYDRFAHEVNVLLGVVWKIVAWELITAYIALEAVELNDKKNEKRKKVVYGKGFSEISLKVKDRVQSKGGDAVEMSGLLERWVEDLLAFLDLKDPKFGEFLVEVKKTVESNEKTRLPKLPKVIP